MGWPGRSCDGRHNGRRLEDTGTVRANPAHTGTVRANRPAISSLRSIQTPKPPDLARYVREEPVLVVLGKALFWDTQLSSDNKVACASCHFHAGADHRPQNQLSAVNGHVPPNQLLSSVHLPFSHQEMEAGWRVASAGVLPRRLTAVGERGAVDQGIDLHGAQYANVHGANVRQVTKRNAPSVINAVYSVRQFWDGRASETFNGQDSSGDSAPTASVLVVKNGTLSRERVSIKQSGLASQALEPPLDDREMSYQGRTWPMLGRKMLAARPLALQYVAPDDSVLGQYVGLSGRGLSQDLTYLSLIRTAFQPEYWSSVERVDEFSQSESNFALFFGLAIQAYESTLVSDDTPYDRYLEGKPGLTPPELEGLAFFERRLCATCHVAPELTLASYRGVYRSSPYPSVEPDSGFFPTGVEATPNDIGLGGVDRFGSLLSAVARKRPELAQWMRGFFKTPNLRNVELTGPYFHTGSKATLEDVINFYTFAGDYSNAALVAWGPDPRERVVMPAFLKALTDDRVRYERAPFDHPELCVAIGHIEPRRGTFQRTRLPATDRFALVPAVGARGNHVPLQTFEELLRGIGSDGSRAHSLTETCQKN